jgi:hypothetical protein
VHGDTVRTDSGDDRLNPVVPGVDVSHDHSDRNHDHPHVTYEHHGHHGQADHVHVEAAPPTVASRSVVINVGEHTGALVLVSNDTRSGMEVEIHSMSQPDARTHVWVLPREGRDGVVYAAIFPSLESGDYAIIDVDGSIADVVAVPPNRVTYANWM